MGALTESVVEFVQGDALAGAPDEAVATAVTGFTDCVGVMLAGAAEPLARRLAAHAAASGGAAVSRVLLTGCRRTPAQAALIGTGAAHAQDFDDYAYSNHVSALLVPAILAESEREGLGGRAMIEAYLAGFEVWGAVMKREPDHLHSKGWHPTGVLGPLGVAAALSRLRGLSKDRIRNALGLAAASGGGVMDNFGTQAKPYQGARAAEAGVVCVELALAGVDAGENALDGDGGLLAALSPAGNVDRRSRPDWLGSRWLAVEEGVNTKLHPTVGASQRTIDAAIQLHRDHDLVPRSIRRIIVHVSEKHAAVMRFHRPRNAMEAKFSAEFGVSAALVAGRVGLEEVSDRFVQRDDVQSLLRKVHLDIGPDDDPGYPVGAAADRVVVELDDGRRIESDPVRRFRGHADNPLSPAELRGKFVACAEPRIGASRCAELFDLLQRLDELDDVGDLPTVEIRYD